MDVLTTAPEKSPRCDCWIGTSGFRQTPVSSTVIQCDLKFPDSNVIKQPMKFWWVENVGEI